MASWQGNVALVFATAALGITLYNQFGASKPLNKPQPAKYDFSSVSGSVPLEDRENLVALHGYILDLETRINALEQSSPKIEPTLIAEQIDKVIEQREKERIAEATKRNPSVNWFRNLPDDYRQRIKADQHYASKSINDAFSALLNINNSDDDRLAAYGQLKMTLGMLRRDLDENQHTAVVDAMLNISEYTSEPTTRIPAIENLSRLDSVSPKLADYFQKLLQSDDNDYVRSVSASALVSQFYRANQLDKKEFALELAQRIQSLESSGDSKVADIMTDSLKHPRLREELNKVLGNSG